MKLYFYIYARLYSWNLRKWGKSDSPETNAVLGVSFLQFLNINLFLGLLEIFDGPDVTFYLKENKLITILILGLIYLINRRIYLVDERYKRITEKMLNESKAQRKKHTYLVWLFVVLSFMMVAFLAYLSGQVLNK